MPEVVIARVDDAVKVIYDRDSTLAVIDTIKVRITERAKQHKETEVIFYDVSGLREAQKDLNSIVENNLLAVTAPAHLYALVGETDVKAEFTNNSKSDTYKVEIRRNKDNALIADVAQRGKCAICKEPLLLGEMEVHHITPKTSGGKDNYSNLALVTGDVHKLVHATDPVIIRKYLEKLKNCKLNMVKLNKFRLLAGNCKLEYR